MEKTPVWMVRWGTIVFVFIIVLFFSVANFIKFNTVVNTTAEIIEDSNCNIRAKIFIEPKDINKLKLNDEALLFIEGEKTGKSGTVIKITKTNLSMRNEDKFFLGLLELENTDGLVIGLKGKVHLMAEEKTLLQRIFDPFVTKNDEN